MASFSVVTINPLVTKEEEEINSVDDAERLTAVEEKFNGGDDAEEKG